MVSKVVRRPKMLVPGEAVISLAALFKRIAAQLFPGDFNRQDDATQEMSFAVLLYRLPATRSFFVSRAIWAGRMFARVEWRNQARCVSLDEHFLKESAEDNEAAHN